MDPSEIFCLNGLQEYVVYSGELALAKLVTLTDKL